MPLRVSDTYKANVVGNERKTNPLIILNFNEDNSDYPIGSASATSEQTGKEAYRAINGRIREITYTGHNYIPRWLWDAHYGWWSNNTSDGSGDFGIPEVITISYFSTITAKNYLVIGYEDNYPVDFTIEVSSNGVDYTLIETVTSNTEPFYGHYDNSYRDISYVRISVTKISAINSPVKILQCGTVWMIVLDLPDIDYCDLVEELVERAGDPLGLVSSNYFEFHIYSENDIWKWDNADSPFFMMENMKFSIRPYYGIQEATDVFSFIPLGVFYNENYEVDTDSLIAKFIGYDTIYRIKDMTPPIFALAEDTTVYELFRYLFEGLGFDLGNVKISSELNYKVPYGFFAGEVGANFAGETVGEALQVLAQAGNAYVSCDRFGNPMVRSNFRKNTTPEELTDSDYLYKTKNLQDFSDTYEAVKVRYRIPEPFADETELINLYEYSVPPDGITLELEFPDAVGIVTSIQILGATNVTLESSDLGAISGTLTFANAGTSTETVQVIIYGQKVSFFNTSIERTNLNIDDPKSTLKLSNWLVQDRLTAIMYADSLLQYVTSPSNKYEIEWRGDPRFQIGEIIRINDSTNNTDEEVQIIKQSLPWRSFLGGDGRCEMYARKAIEKIQWGHIAFFHSTNHSATIPEKWEYGCVGLAQMDGYYEVM